jgi:hypothetical protein
MMGLFESLATDAGPFLSLACRHCFMSSLFQVEPEDVIDRWESRQCTVGILYMLNGKLESPGTFPITIENAFII